jgi:hypothetical protein
LKIKNPACLPESRVEISSLNRLSEFSLLLGGVALLHRAPNYLANTRSRLSNRIALRFRATGDYGACHDAPIVG